MYTYALLCLLECFKNLYAYYDRTLCTLSDENELTKLSSRRRPNENEVRIEGKDRRMENVGVELELFIPSEGSHVSDHIC